MLAEPANELAPRAESGTAKRLSEWLLRVWQLFAHLSFSSLTRRIIFLNLTGLIALVIGILYLSQFRAGLIEARIQSLLVQGEIMAGAIASSATAERKKWLYWPKDSNPYDCEWVRVDPPSSRSENSEKLREEVGGRLFTGAFLRLGSIRRCRPR